MRNGRKKPAEATALRRRAEKHLKGPPPKARLPRTEADTQRLLHELQVYQIELKMQIVELRQARDALESQVQENAAEVARRTVVEQRLRRQAQWDEALKAIGQAATSLQPLEGILSQGVETIRQAAAANLAVVRLVDANTKELVMAAHLGVPKEYLAVGPRIPWGQEVAGAVAAAGQPRVVGRPEEQPGRSERSLLSGWVQSLACLPLQTGGQVLGTLTLGHERSEYFTPADLESCQPAAAMLAGAILAEHLRLATAKELESSTASVRQLREEIMRRQATEEALRLSEQKFAKAFTANPAALALTRLSDGRFLEVNDTYLAVTGFRRAEVIGHTADELGVWPTPAARARFVEALRQQGFIRGWEERFRKRSGEEFVGLLSAEVVPVEGEELVLSAYLDITDRKHVEAQLGYLASHDPLTDLCNRRSFQAELTRHLAQAMRYGTKGALLVLDLDHFKDLNDSLGHVAGDEFLVSLANVLRARFRATDLVARLGGDEFAVLLPHTDGHQAYTAAMHLLEAVRQHGVKGGVESIGLTVSIGIALIPDYGASVEEVLTQADLALYQAKASGRNCLAVYSPESHWSAKAGARLSWRQRIREAVERNRFILDAQPVLHLGQNRISQYELLLRMVGEGGEIVPPSDFLDIAEQHGLIHDVDRWVVRRAIQMLAEQRRAGRDLLFEVNLSAKAFADGDLLSLIQDELRSGAIPPGSLVLEVTETAAIANLHQAQTFVQALKELGCQFALDDFGVGFSSFSHLKYLPVDYLKIDGNFVRNLAHDPLDQHLVQAMVAVARGLGKQTIAEWVGDAETISLLREYGVEYAQGYYIGRPGTLTQA